MPLGKRMVLKVSLLPLSYKVLSLSLKRDNVLVFLMSLSRLFQSLEA